MDWVRVGLSLRALRRRRGWRQADLAAEARCSRSLIGSVERGHADRLTGRALEQLAESLGARLRVNVLWHGEELDRLLDQRHAALVELVVRELKALGWEVFVEITFQVGAERGSIDVLALHPDGALLVVEVKSVLPDVQSALAGLDRKARLATRIAAERRLRFSSVSRLLVLPENATTRRRVQVVAATLATAYPLRNVAVRRWLRAPSAPLSGILFLSNATERGSRRTRARPQGSAKQGRAGESSQLRIGRDF